MARSRRPVTPSIPVAVVDAAIDALRDEDPVTQALIRLLRDHGAWEYETDGFACAVVESTGAYWCVVRHSDGSCSTRHATYLDAEQRMRAIMSDQDTD